MSSLKKKISIKTRILISILLLVGFIFCCIIVSFNFLVGENIKANSEDQLSEGIRIVERFNKNLNSGGVSKNRPMEYQEIIRDIENQGILARMRTKSEVIIVNQEYQVQRSNLAATLSRDLVTDEKIAEALKESQAPLGNKEILRLSTEAGTYYAATVRLDQLDQGEPQYMILFIDIGSSLELASQINRVLALILAMAFLLAAATAALLAGKLVRPIKQLGEFAERIGRGDFKPCEVSFADREIAGLADSMNKSASQLLAYDKSQKIFFQNASHELRTPLMSIKGYAEAIQYKVIEPGKASQVILEETDRLAEMVEDLLYISKADNLSRDFVKQTCDLRELVSNAGVSLSARAINKGIGFEYAFDEKPVLFDCDEKAMTRAILNVAENALRYAESKVVFRCGMEEEWILIETLDDGPGIDEKELPYIFERFFKGDQGKNGIGLSIVKTIVKEHGGQVFAENLLKGTRFTIRFKKG